MLILVKTPMIKYFIKLLYNMYIYFIVLNYQKFKQEKGMTPKSFSMGEYIAPLYHLKNLMVNIKNNLGIIL